MGGSTSSGLYERIAACVNKKERESIVTPISRAQVKRAVMTMGYAAGAKTIGKYLADAGAVRTGASHISAGKELLRVMTETVPGLVSWGEQCKSASRIAAAGQRPIRVMPTRDATVIQKYAERVISRVKTDSGHVQVDRPGPNTRKGKSAALAPNAVHAIDGSICARVVCRLGGPVLSVFDA